jgi:hypothetical protein
VRLSDLGRTMRHVRHLRPAQITAQLRHLLLGEGRRSSRSPTSPALRVEAAAVAFLPAPAHARYDGALGFELIHRRHRFRDEIDWSELGNGPLWAFHLNQFDYARAPSLSPKSRWQLIDHWIENCHDGPGWAPHPISLRTLSWGKLLLTPGALELSPDRAERVRTSIAHQIETLAEAFETRLQANHLFSNIASVVFAGLMFEGERADAWLKSESDLRREISLQIQGDGSHIEGSPMYHALLLESVLDLINLSRAVGNRAPAGLVASLEDAASRMLGAHRIWTHPDAEIALLGDAAFDIAHLPQALETYAASLGIDPIGPARPGALDDAGVFRMESGKLVLIATAAPPMPAYQPGHAHCDALSFELSIGDERVVTDTGVTEYIPGALRDISRETASHATLQIDGGEQSEIWAAHRVGGRCTVEIENSESNRLVAACNSWSTRHTRHRRSFELDAGRLVIEDAISGEPASVRFALPLAPGLEPRLRASDSPTSSATPSSASVTTAGTMVLWLRLRDGESLRIDLPEGVRWRIERAAYFPRFGERIDRTCLVGDCDGFRLGTWSFSLSP